MTIQFTDTAKGEIQAAVDAAQTDVLTAVTTAEKPEATLATKPGLFYSVVAGGALDGMAVRSSTMATDDTLTVELPKYDNAGFYTITASVRPLPVVE